MQVMQYYLNLFGVNMFNIFKRKNIFRLKKDLILPLTEIALLGPKHTGWNQHYFIFQEWRKLIEDIWELQDGKKGSWSTGFSLGSKSSYGVNKGNTFEYHWWLIFYFESKEDAMLFKLIYVQ
jgi:hypothetical protein